MKVKISEEEKMIYVQKVVDNMQQELNANPELFETYYNGSEMNLNHEVHARVQDLLEMHAEAFKKAPLMQRLKYRFFPDRV